MKSTKKRHWKTPERSTLLDQMADSHRRSGIHKLLRQLKILEDRVQSAHNDRAHDFPHSAFTSDEFMLDVETYYTVAHDLLKLASELLPQREGKQFRAEAAYKTISAVRTHLVRHAYGNRPENDPFAGCAWHATRGLILKGGSPLETVGDPGFFQNRDALGNLLLKRYRVRELVVLP